MKSMDEGLGLRARGLTSSVIVALGYRAAEDFNAKLPKSRLPLEQVLPACERQALRFFLVRRTR